jgi:hypothetical protein
MTWEEILKFDDFAGDMDGTAADMDRENSDRIAEYNRAKGFLEEDIANVIRELEELQEMMESGQFIEDYGTNEMKQLSDALGKVSVLLQ